MNRKKGFMLSTGVVVGILIGAPYLYAESPDGYGKVDREEWKAKWEEKIADIHKQLGVTPEQEAQLKANREKHRAEAEALRAQIQDKRGQMRAELQRGEFDEGKVRGLHQELKSLKSQKDDLRLEGIFEVRKILTPEQFNKFMELKKDFKGHRKQDDSK